MIAKFFIQLPEILISADELRDLTREYPNPHLQSKCMTLEQAMQRSQGDVAARTQGLEVDVQRLQRELSSSQDQLEGSRRQVCGVRLC